jgi:hypothetical protein
MRMILSAAAALAFAVPAAAQAQQQPALQQVFQPGDRDRPDIVVVGDPAVRDRQIRTFVEALDDVPGTDPMGRFDRTDLCPAAVGLSEAQNAAIAARMRQIAAAVPLPLAAPDCRPNILVLIAPDKEEMIAALRRRHPIYFRNAFNQIIELPNERGPATAWHLSARVDRNGQPLGFDEETGVEIVSTTVAPSRISMTVRPIFLAAVVVIEARSLAGLTTTQVGDYAAMRAYAPIRPRGLPRNANSVLTVLDAPMDALIPASVTEWDLAYLRGLYATPAYQSAPRQRADIRRAMTRDLEQGGQPRR